LVAHHHRIETAASNINVTLGMIVMLVKASHPTPENGSLAMRVRLAPAVELAARISHHLAQRSKAQVNTPPEQPLRLVKKTVCQIVALSLRFSI